MEFHDKLSAYLIELGADLIGFADLTALPAAARMDLPSGIAFGIALDPAAVALVPQMASMQYYQAYQGANRRLDEISILVQDFLMQNGYHAVAQSMEYVNRQREQIGPDLRTGRAYLPYKTVASLAGLGWVGKNNLLITDQFGSAIRFSSVLTDAPLPVQKQAAVCRCDSCRICVDACPGHAIKNKTWTPQTDRDELFDLEACKAAIVQRGKPLNIQNGSCGVCIAICPYTQKYLDAATSTEHINA
jgi:epoxyqueuosine reductase